MKKNSNEELKKMSAEDFRMYQKKMNEAFWEKQIAEAKTQQEERKNTPIVINNDSYGDCDHPDTMEDSTATVLYIFVMLGALIFTDRVLIWIVATIIYFRFRNIHKN